MRANGIPPELLRSIPRSVRLTAGGYMLAVLALALAAGSVASAVLLTSLARQGAARRARAEREGVPATAEVTGLGRIKEGKRTVEYRYTADGGEFEGSVRLRRREWEGLQRRSRIPIFHLGRDPGQSWLPGHEPGGVPFFVAPIVSVCCLAGAAGIWLGVHRQRRLLEEGRPALATVTGARRTGEGYQVKYEYTALSGARRTGWYAQGKKVEPGVTAVILHDPDNPRRAARYPLALWRTP